MKSRDWTTLSRAHAYKAGTPDEISFRVDEVRFPSGRVGRYVFAEFPFEVCFVLLVGEDDRFVLIRQFRYPIQTDIICVPAGSPAIGESLEDCARRESEEETGLRPRSLRKMLDFYPIPGSTDLRAHLFLGTDLESVDTPRDPDEPTTLVVIDRDQALELIENGEIRDLPTITALLLCAREK